MQMAQVANKALNETYKLHIKQHVLNHTIGPNADKKRITKTRKSDGFKAKCVEQMQYILENIEVKEEVLNDIDIIIKHVQNIQNAPNYQWLW